jgi:hypothetical protein
MLNPRAEPDPKEIVLCIYESSLDGFAAAWVVRKAFRENLIPVELTSLTDQPKEQLTGRNVILINRTVAWNTRSRLHISNTDVARGLSEPLPFKQWKRVFPYGIETTAPDGKNASSVYDTSLCAAAWNFFYPETEMPLLLEGIADYVAGTNRYSYSSYYYAASEASPREFPLFDKLVDDAMGTILKSSQ